MTREQLIKHWDVIKAFKEGKNLKVRYGDSFIENPCPSFGYYEEYLIEDNIKPTKRLPTIEEVEKWFLENMVFKLKLQSNGLYRMETICIEAKALRIGGRNILIDEFCEDFTHYDGSELYITED